MAKNGEPYGSGTFYNKIFGTVNGIRNTNRKTSNNHLSDPKCVVCETPIVIRGKSLDHIIPKHLNGPDDLENQMALCRQHNSSKGKKDLIQWWMDKEWPAIDLPRNILCMYARLMWKLLPTLDIPKELPEYTKAFMIERVENLPSDDHRIALYGSTYATYGFMRWEHTRGN